MRPAAALTMGNAHSEVELDELCALGDLNLFIFAPSAFGKNVDVCGSSGLLISLDIPMGRH